VHSSIEFTEADLPFEQTQPEVVTLQVREMLDGKMPVRIADMARALKMNYVTCMPHLRRAAIMDLPKLILR
jgi:hypothetical protein